MADDNDTPDADDTPSDSQHDDTGDADDVFDKDRAMSTIRKLRGEVREAKKAAKDAADLKARLDTLEAEKLTDQEKLARRAEDAEAKVTAAEEKLRRANLIAELARPEHGIVNAQAAARLIDGVEYDDGGEPANLDDILDQFLDANPYLRSEPGKRKAPNADGGKGRQDTDAPSLTQAEAETATRLGMTPEDYAKYRDAGSAMSITDWQKLKPAAAT